MTHIKQNIAPIAVQTFEQALKEKHSGPTVTAHKLGEIELNEPILDTTLFMRQITMAMYSNNVYPADWLNSPILLINSFHKTNYIELLTLGLYKQGNHSQSYKS